MNFRGLLDIKPTLLTVQPATGVVPDNELVNKQNVSAVHSLNGDSPVKVVIHQ